MALAKNAYATTNFLCAIDGAGSNFLMTFDPPTLEADKIEVPLGAQGETERALGNPTYGDAKCTINPAHSAPWLTIINSVFDKSCVEFQARVDLCNHDYKSKRAVQMDGCLIKEVGLGSLKAGDGKKLLEFSLTWEMETLAFLKGDDKVISGVLGSKNKNWLASNFEPIGLPGGIPGESVTEIDMGKMAAKIGKEHVGMHRFATKHYTAWDFSGLKTTHSSIGYDAALAYVQKIVQDGNITDGEYTDWEVALKTQTMKDVLGTVVYTKTAPQKFTWSPQLKGGADSMSTFSIDWLAQTARFKPEWK